MSLKQGTLAAIVAAALIGAGAQAEALPVRDQYRAEIEPVCERGTEASRRILSDARKRTRDGKLRLAGTQFIRASRRFGATISTIVAVPRPPDDDARLRKWFGFLRITQKNVRMIGVALKEENRLRANHQAIRAERSGNAANNVASIFMFRHCRVTRSDFS